MIVQEIQYLGPVSSYRCYRNGGKLMLESNETYQKRSYRNRCYIAGPNGVILLSIPLKKGKNESLNIKEVCISYDENWVSQHLKSIRTCYGSSPYFEYYYYDLENILRSRKAFLYDLNKTLLDFLTKTLSLSISIDETEDYHKNYAPDVTDLRGTSPFYNTYESHHNKTYPQVFEEKLGFIPNLSIIDLLFCTGPESVYYLV